MYVCVYVCYVCIHVCMYVYMYVCMYLYMDVCMYIYIYIQRNANANSTSQNLGSARYINMQSRNTNCTKIEN